MTACLPTLIGSWSDPVRLPDDQGRNTGVHAAPAAVLLILAEDREAASTMFDAFGGHFLLICRGAQQALATAHDFSPDVVLVDEDLLDSEALRSLLRSVREQGSICVSLTASTPRPGGSPEAASLFDYELSLPVLDCELEWLLRQIQGHGRG
jgi:hypothetical protein